MQKKCLIYCLTALCYFGLSGVSALHAQRFSVFIEKLDKLEQQIKALKTAHRKEINNLKRQLFELKQSEGSSQFERPFADLTTQIEQISYELQQLKRNQVLPAQAAIPAQQLESQEFFEALQAMSEETLAPADEAQPDAGLVSPAFDYDKILDPTQQDGLKGVTFEAVYTSEISSNLVGGVRRKTVYLDNFDVILSIDAEEMMGWTGASFSLYGLGNQGGSPSENIGDAQGVSNIDAPNSWKLYEAWVQQNALEDKLSVLIGLYDLNSEFDAIETAGLFLNGSQGIGPDISQTGLNGPSIFPTTSFGVRFKLQPTDAFYFQTTMLDGVPGDPDNPSGTQVKLHKEDGLFVSTELGFYTGTDGRSPYGKLALGLNFYTSEFDDILEVDNFGNPLRCKARPVFYALAEKTVYREREDTGQGLAIYGRIGFADNRVNQFGSYTGAGLVYTGLFPGRTEDQLGFAIAAAHNGSKFKQAQLEAGAPVDGSEVNLELTYRAALLPWLAVQPNLQYVINPGTDPGINNAFVSGARFEFSF